METALKQRLVGAMVLVALAVIFLPMLIKGPAPESGVGDVSLDMPATPESGFRTHELPLVTPQPGAATNMPTPSGERLPTVEAGGPGAAVMMPPSTAAGDFAVSFGSYATDADAARVVGALTASQLVAYHEPVASSGRTLHRVRIGPFATRAEAEAARLRAAHVSDRVEAKVVVLDTAQAGASTAAAPASAKTPQASTASTGNVSVAQPLTNAGAVTSAAPLAATKPAPAAAPATKPASASTAANSPAATPPAAAPATPTPAKPAPAPVAATRPAAADVGFAVQLGAFASADEAVKLRDRARAAGFSAFVEPVNTDKGTLNRVRIGPVADRGDAERLRDQVAGTLGLPGIVRPHP